MHPSTPTRPSRIHCVAWVREAMPRLDSARASPIRRVRDLVGHLHYFSRDTALATLKDAGYQVIDHFYTANMLELPNIGWRGKLMLLPRRLAFSLHPDLAARILGGYSLMVLAR